MVMEFAGHFPLFNFEIHAKLMVGHNLSTHYKFQERFGH